MERWSPRLAECDVCHAACVLLIEVLCDGEPALRDMGVASGGSVIVPRDTEMLLPVEIFKVVCFGQGSTKFEQIVEIFCSFTRGDSSFCRF